MQLIPSVLGDKQVSRRVDGKTLGVANSSRETISRGKSLICFAGVVAPNTATGLQFSAWVRTGYFGLPVLWLAGIAHRGNVDIHRSIFADDEWMHRMVSAQRQSGNDGFRRSLGHDSARRN